MDTFRNYKKNLYIFSFIRFLVSGVIKQDFSDGEPGLLRRGTSTRTTRIHNPFAQYTRNLFLISFVIPTNEKSMTSG